MRVEMDAKHPNPRALRRAADALRRGAVIGYPTDTVYGLGCDVTQKKAVDRLYQIKNMPREHPVAFICPDLSDVARYAIVHDAAYRLMRRLLPGPYCFILQATREVPRMLMMKRRTIGLRVPDNPIAVGLVRELGNPIASTSAVWQGEELNDPDEIDDRFKGLEMVLDSGYGGLVPSTLIDFTGDAPVVLREGAGSIDTL